MWGLDEVMFVKHSIQYTKYTPNSRPLFSPGMSGRSRYLGNMLQSACDGKSAFWWRRSLSCPGAEGSHGKWTYQPISWPQAHPRWRPCLGGEKTWEASQGPAPGLTTENVPALCETPYIWSHKVWELSSCLYVYVCVCLVLRKYDNINPLDLDYYTMGETTYIWKVTRIYTFFFIHKGRETMYWAEGELNSLVLALPWITTYAS